MAVVTVIFVSAAYSHSFDGCLSFRSFMQILSLYTELQSHKLQRTLQL